MRGFIPTKVYANGEALTALGTQETPPTYSLYTIYKGYCIYHAYEACSWSKFGPQFLITLRSLRVQVTKV